MAEAILICCVYIGPFLAALFIGGAIFEIIIPAILRRRARKRKWNG